jgi:hypothetical protein
MRLFDIKSVHVAESRSFCNLTVTEYRQTSARLFRPFLHKFNSHLPSLLPKQRLDCQIYMMSESLQAAEAAAPTSPPFITVAGIPNFRDLGGYPISSSAKHSIKREIIYRCGEPSKVTKDGITTIQRLGITHVYDLRSNNEIERNQAAGRGGVVQWDGCERVFVPVFTDQDYSPENLAVRFKDYASDGTEVWILKV